MTRNALFSTQQSRDAAAVRYRPGASHTGAAGFTMLELLIAVAVAAILSVIAIPSFVKSIRSNRGVTDANNLLAVMTLARSSAISRDANVILCPANSISTPACTTTGTWDQGYILFVDLNQNGVYDSATDVLVRIEVPLSNNSTITFNQSGTALTSLCFTGLGQASTLSSGTPPACTMGSNPVGYFDVKPANKTTGERYVVLKQIGRAAVCAPTDSNCGL